MGTVLKTVDKRQLLNPILSSKPFPFRSRLLSLRFTRLYYVLFIILFVRPNDLQMYHILYSIRTQSCFQYYDIPEFRILIYLFYPRHSIRSMLYMHSNSRSNSKPFVVSPCTIEFNISIILRPREMLFADVMEQQTNV